MAYRELTCDEQMQSLEQIERRSMVKQPDGTWAQQVVYVTAGDGGDFNDDFSDDFNI